MNNLGVCLLVQLSLGSGVAGLLWPEKLMPIFEALMFPWSASYRMVRIHSLAAVGVALIILAKLLTAGF
ncbi:MAG TPA: hypothetical protein VMI10_22995 [Terriglobales bacterium]|nr:hypothetical protein [Terriglobales bacterium]